MLNIEEIKSRLDTLTARKVELNDEAAGIDRSVRDIAMDLHKENEMLRRHADALHQQLEHLGNLLHKFDMGDVTIRDLREATGPTNTILDNVETETKFFYRKEEAPNRPLVTGGSVSVPSSKAMRSENKAPLGAVLTKAETTPLNGSHSA